MKVAYDQWKSLVLYTHQHLPKHPLLHGIQYPSVPVQVVDVLVRGQGGIAALEVAGFRTPVAIYMGVIEATSILYSSGVEFRRPFTTGTWSKSLQVRAIDPKP